MYGLQSTDIDYILRQVKQFPEIEAIGIFGSRANGSYTSTSDIDLVLYGKKIDYAILQEVTELLEEHSPFPFFVDVVHYESIKDPVFKKQIDLTVRSLYKQQSPRS